MRFTAVHPGPIVHTPARARAERMSYDRLETSIEIHEASIGDMPLAGFIPEKVRWTDGKNPAAIDQGALWVQDGKSPVAIHQGALWVQVSGRSPHAMTRKDLAAFLLDQPLEDGKQRYPNELCHTPLFVPMTSIRNERGTQQAAGRLGIIAEDHRDAAQAAIRSFATQSLRLRQGIVWARLPGPFAVHNSDFGMTNAYRITSRPGSNVEVVDIACDPADIAANYAHLGSKRLPENAEETAGVHLIPHGITVPLPSPRDDILRLAANWGVTCAARDLARSLTRGTLDENGIATIKAGLALLRPYVALASISAIPASAAADPVHAVAAALRGALGVLPAGRTDAALVKRHLRWSEKTFLPRLGLDAHADDLDDLASLSPTTGPG